MNRILVWTVIAASLAGGAAVGSSEQSSNTDQRSYPVDSGRVLAPALEGAPLVIRRFSTEHTSFGTAEKTGKTKAQDVARQMESTAPPALAQSLVDQLRKEKVFPSVALLDDDEPLPEGSMVLEGEFTELNPGSRGKRFWVGLGAGRSKVCIRGRVLGPDREELLTFDHCRSGTMGWFGGRAEGMMFTDVAGAAEKVSEFLAGWSRGAYRR